MKEQTIKDVYADTLTDLKGVAQTLAALIVELEKIGNPNYATIASVAYTACQIESGIAHWEDRIPLVPAALACPQCGNQVMDELMPLTEEEEIRCRRCGNQY